MNFHFLPGQNYDCVQCGKGCLEALQVRVDQNCLEIVEQSPLALRVIQEHGVEPFPTNEFGERVVRRLDKRCVFLDPDNLCSIHRDFGIESKPVACRAFPFTVTPTPDGVFVGISHYCTAAKENAGRPLEAHRSEVEELMKKIRFAPMGFEPIELGGEVSITWKAYVLFEDWLTLTCAQEGFKKAMGRGLGVAAALLAGEQKLVDEALMAAVLDSSPLDAVAGDEVMEAALFYAWAVCVAHVDANSKADFDLLTQSLLQGGDLRFHHWDWQGSRDLVLAAAGSMGYQEGVDRYLSGLLFAKQLAEGRSLFANLLVFYRLPDWLAFYSGLSSLERGMESPDSEDVKRALDFVELHFLTHGRRLDEMHQTISDHLLQQFAALSA